MVISKSIYPAPFNLTRVRHIVLQPKTSRAFYVDALRFAICWLPATFR
jgi:hypothetical protein